MTRLNRLLHAYTSRRSPWGPPWWIYGVAFGLANVIRQAATIATSADIPAGIGVAWWLASAIVVIAVVNTVAVVLYRRGVPAGRWQTLDPVWPLRRRDDHGRPADGSSPRHSLARDPTGPTTPDTAPSRPARRQPSAPRTWAPWWLYLAVIVGANHARRAVGADGGSPPVRVGVALAFSAAVFIVLTVVSRAVVRRTGGDGRGRNASP